jgi:hypothetical protein
LISCNKRLASLPKLFRLQNCRRDAEEEWSSEPEDEPPGKELEIGVEIGAEIEAESEAEKELSPDRAGGTYDR